MRIFKMITRLLSCFCVIGYGVTALIDMATGVRYGIYVFTSLSAVMFGLIGVCTFLSTEKDDDSYLVIKTFFNLAIIGLIFGALNALRTGSLFV